MPPKKKAKAKAKPNSKFLNSGVTEYEEIPRLNVKEETKAGLERRQKKTGKDGFLLRESASPIYLPSQNLQIGFTAGLIPNLPEQPTYARSYPFTNTPPAAISAEVKNDNYRAYVAKKEEAAKNAYERAQEEARRDEENRSRQMNIRLRERPINSQTSMTIPTIPFGLTERAENDMSFISNQFNRLAIPSSPKSDDDTQFAFDGSGLKKRLHKLHRYMKGCSFNTPPKDPPKAAITATQSILDEIPEDIVNDIMSFSHTFNIPILNQYMSAGARYNQPTTREVLNNLQNLYLESSGDPNKKNQLIRIIRELRRRLKLSVWEYEPEPKSKSYTDFQDDDDDDGEPTNRSLFV